MGIGTWLAKRREYHRKVREDVDLSNNEDLIARYVPECSGMGFVKGGVYVLETLRAEREAMGEILWLGYQERLLAHKQSWDAEQRVAPWWAALAILRRYQADLEAVDGH